jgi:hypothetical protein
MVCIVIRAARRRQITCRKRRPTMGAEHVESRNAVRATPGWPVL